MNDTPVTSILFILPPHLPYEIYTRPQSNVRHVLKNDGRSYSLLISDMPLGILSLSSYVKRYARHDVSVKLLDFNIELNKLDEFNHESFASYYHEHLSREYLDFAPDIIAISSLFTPSYQNLLDIAACCRKLFSKALIVGGGGVPSIMHREIFQTSHDFDGLCYGEGERPFLALIEAQERKEYLETHPSWITSAKEAASFIPVHDFIEDLDEIPFFDYGLCDKEEYRKYPAVSAYAGVKERQANFYVMSSRGCPFKCIFCAAHMVHGRSVRYHSLARVKEDLTRLRDEFGATIIVFQDDHLMGDPRRALEIIRFVEKERIHAFFQNLAIYALSREILESLARAGTTHLNLSIESGSERVLKQVMHKPLKLSMVEQVTKNCHELGIYTAGSILIGLPGETRGRHHGSQKGPQDTGRELVCHFLRQSVDRQRDVRYLQREELSQGEVSCQ